MTRPRSGDFRQDLFRRFFDTPPTSGPVSVRRAELREQQQAAGGAGWTIPSWSLPRKPSMRVAGVVDVVDSAAAPPAPAAPVATAPAPQVLPSERLTRLAELAATALERAETSSPVLLSDQALEDVLAAVDASTAANTKKAYRSDWARFTTWAGDRRVPRRCRLPRWWSRTT